MKLTSAWFWAIASLRTVTCESVYCSDNLSQTDMCNMSGFASNYPNYVPRKPKTFHRCGVPGSLQNPNIHGTSCYTPQFDDCLTLCKGNSPYCATFSYNSVTKQCYQYTKSLPAQGFKRGESDTKFYSNACFQLGDPSTKSAPTATCARKCTPELRNIVVNYGEFADFDIVADPAIEYHYEQPEGGAGGYSTVLDVSMVSDQSDSEYAYLTVSKTLQGVVPGETYNIAFGSGYQTEDGSYEQAPNVSSYFEGNQLSGINVCGSDADINQNPGERCSTDYQRNMLTGLQQAQATSHTPLVEFKCQFLAGHTDSWQALLAGLQVSGKQCSPGTQYNGFVY